MIFSKYLIKNDMLQHFFNTASITELLKGNWGRDDVIIIHQWLSELHPKMRRNMRLKEVFFLGGEKIGLDQIVSRPIHVSYEYES